MSLRISTTVVAVSLALVTFATATGCAVAPQDGTDDGTSDPSALPGVDEGSVTTEATGRTCVCGPGQEYQNGLCYTTCKAGWSGEGPVCWKACASGFKDTGWFCQRDSSIVSADTSSCPWYNKCGLGDDCSKCPAGYSNDGCTCRRDAYIYAQESYGRGVGVAPTCTTN